MNQQEELSIRQNTIWNSIGSFTYLFAQWLLSLIIVRISSDLNDVGNFALAISITNIFFSLACFNVRPYLVSDVTNQFKVNEYVTFRIVTCVLAFVLCIVYVNIFSYSREQQQSVVLYMVFKLGEAWVDLLHSFEQKASRMDIGGISLLIRGILSVFVFAGALKITRNLQMSIVCMGVVTIGFIMLYDMYKVRRFVTIIPKCSFQRIKVLFIEFLPLTVASFLNLFSMTYPRQVLEMYSGTELLGIYATIATPTIIIQVAASYIFNPLLTTFAFYNSKNEQRNFTKLFLKTCFIIIVIAFISMFGVKLLGKWGIALLYGKRMEQYAYLLNTTIIYVSCNAFVGFSWNILVVLRKLKQLLIINILGVLYCMITAKHFIVTYGMVGVNYVLISYTVIISVFMLSILIYNLNKKEKPL